MKIRFSYLLPLFCAAFFWGCNPGSEQNGSTTRPDTTDGQPAAEASPPQEVEQERYIVFFGNSLTAGYGLDASESFPTLIQHRLDSLGYAYKVVNAGLSGETTAGGNKRLDWVLERQPVDIFVLELGANDGLRGLNLDQTQQNLEEMIDKVRAVYPQAEIILAGMMVPPNLGQPYSSRFNEIFPAVAKKKAVTLLPFLLQDVAGEPSLNLPDRIHPNAEGQKLVARNVWQVLEQIIVEQQRG
ncbi:arylesterase [Cesiribacter andamanensis]|uniref:Esterase TesA n=1 Tax=Cesiribacter andamanensis AMV16 TaxID=1279009 RepID=M7MWS1_9BACT|nr:arylesterase [Cesiribacter andamanensis]EMR00863.1 Esterase TesA precursor [Cesiribacter andamanensis AMV16]